MSLFDNPELVEYGDDRYEATVWDTQALQDLPVVSSRQVSLERRLARSAALAAIPQLLAPGAPFVLGSLEVSWFAAGLNRSGVFAQLTWPRLHARLGLGFETPVAHALVDHLLGFDRLPSESLRPVTPVEWGILGFVFARALDRLGRTAGPLGPWDLTIDRVNTDPFDTLHLGRIVTWHWPVRIGQVEGSMRLWIPESILDRLDGSSPPSVSPVKMESKHAVLSAYWRAEAGTITLAKGFARLKKGAVLPIDGTRLTGTAASPVGPIDLVCRDRSGLNRFPAQAVPNGSGGRLILLGPVEREPSPREPIAMTPTPAAPPTTPDVPVTLVVELGRVNLPLSRLADLKTGDVVELGRHSREPVELTSNGRLVARGELVQIDTELGVRVTNVFL